ncbi:helix-turn-helix domain-containing protein [Krasilnikovia sp. MM14-A1259]|uniref:helix-turn-helix domain-containing protein n=1 Tax=Krasilnikovia sp. MM14-A1259 TaxID=3373539 RepID=UPI0037F2FB92
MPVPNGAAIKAIRTAKGWKGITFAATVGISRSHLCNIERGKHASDELLRRIADTLSIPLAAITSSHSVDQIAGAQKPERAA